MSQIEGTHVDVRLDLMTNAVFVELADLTSIPTQEVIQHLESDCLASRTRVRVGYTIEVAGKKGVAIKLALRGTWESWMEFDIIAALKDLFLKKGVLQCA